MWEYLTQYYGIDWAAMILVIVGLWLLGRKQKVGFVVNVAGAVLWIVFNVMVDSVAGVLANAILIFVNIQGWWRWSRRPPVRENNESA